MAAKLAVVLIAAGVLDGMDGRSARLLKISSKLGAQLDSLADFLSFGVAPAMLVYLWSLHQVKALGWALALLFATCCALRLARFNTELDATDQPVWMSAFHRHARARGCRLRHHPDADGFCLRGELALHLGLNALVMLAVAVLMGHPSRPSRSRPMVRIKPDWVLPT